MATKPKVLIATPAFAGQLTHHYHLSMMKTSVELLKLGIPYGLLIVPNESLISRGRNSCAQVALEQGFDKLFFIDADMGFSPEQFLAVYNSDKQVVGGTYPLKQAELRLSYNAIHDSIVDLEKKQSAAGVKFSEPRSVPELMGLRELKGNAKGEVEVRHLPTGFMCIDVQVLRDLIRHVPVYTQPDTIDWTVLKKHRDFFPVRVIDGQYESEDWAFCSLVRKHLNCGVWLNANVITTHTGTHTWVVEHDRGALNEIPS